jgi:acetyl esterase/lipase
VPSLQARLTSFLLRQTIKRELAAAKGAEGVRRVFNRGGLYKIPAGIRIGSATIDGVAGEWIEGASEKPILLFLHGGGYIACTLETHRPYGCFFAQHGFRVFSVDYRLAPEHPFPAGLDDAVAVYRGLQAQFPETPIVISGDSAGGGLALATMLRLKAEGVALPSAAALFSPLTDLTGVGDSRVSNDRRCAMFYGKGLDMVQGYYAPGVSMEGLHDPFISPVYGNYSGFPPLLIHVGEDETLRDDSVRLAERAKAAGVAVDLKVWPAVPHDWQLLYTLIPEGRASLEQAAEFLAKHAVSNAKATA